MLVKANRMQKEKNNTKMMNKMNDKQIELGVSKEINIENKASVR